MAARVGWVTAAIVVVVLLVATSGQRTGSFDVYKIGFVGGLVGYAAGYGVTRLVLGREAAGKR